MTDDCPPFPGYTSKMNALTESAGSDIDALFQERCGTCHSSSLSLGELDLSSYTAAMTGGVSGPAITPGDADSSGLIIVQATGGHPGQLQEAEILHIREWIEAGAPQN